ncbi:MAG: rRNA maturation RNase YbeY [Candidatus Eremiobacteraeota bacterium]|nr:rRNA maturation RNase YbeY [Candidatus Eremiobacteraeota bacterium]
MYVRAPKSQRILVGPIRRAALKTLARAAPTVCGDLTVVLAGDRTVHRLNLSYRNQDRPTDVLAFELSTGQEADEPFGDVIISIETACRQAEQYKADLESEVLRLLVHGTLHLCGYDHHERRAAARMHAMTRRILKDLVSDA